MTTLHHDTDATSLPGLIRNSLISDYTVCIMSAPSFISAFASIKIKQDAIEKAKGAALAWFNSLDTQQTKALLDAFPRTHTAFSNLLAYSLLKLCEMNQERFLSESINEPNPVYKDMIQNNPLVVFAIVPYNHVLVYRRNNRPNLALSDAVNGSPIMSTFHCLLTSAVKQYVHIFLSVQCSQRQDSSDEYFLNSHMNPKTFRNWMEDARTILRDHVLSASSEQRVRQIRRCLDEFEKISQAAATCTIASVPAEAPVGDWDEDASGDSFS